MKHRVFLSAALSALMVTACGSADDAAQTGTDGASTAAQSGSANTTQVPAVLQGATMPEAGEDFLARFAELPNTQVTESGLVLQTLVEGSGASPRTADLVRINFRALVGGADEPFESTWKNGGSVIVTPDLVLPGWSEALKLMKKGGTARAAMPPELAFGAAGMPNGPVGPNQPTVFDIELVDIYPNDDEAALDRLLEEANAEIDGYRTEAERLQGLLQQQALAISTVNQVRSQRFITQAAARAETQVTQSGLVYEVLTDGGDGASPVIGDTVRVQYRGTLPDGTEFDSSYSRGEPSEFELGRVIAGWNEGLQLMQPGDKYKFYIPANLAYGQQGAGEVIGPNQSLAFEVELIAVNPEPSAEGE